jgi:hypothetical protein
MPSNKTQAQARFMEAQMATLFGTLATLSMQKKNTV